MAIRRLVSILGLTMVAASIFLVESAAAESKVRIVRLSDVEGAVQIERARGEGLEKAFLNLPIVEGSRVKTGNDGRAEIEFEDGSTARLGPESELQFTHLALADNGQKVNGMKLAKGTFYGNLDAKKGDQYSLNVAQVSLGVPEAAHFRLTIDTSAEATVAVFKGKVSVGSDTVQAENSSPKLVEVPEKHSAKINLAATDPAQKDAIVVAKNYDEDPLDGWDRQQNGYHQRYASNSGSGFASPYGYGLSDLNYYGAFNTIPGYGYAWQPYFANAAWSPFTDGAWAFYPGAGYMWVSGYPWGWMPYYYGTWAMAPGYGWIWQPGSWNSWNAVPRVANAAAAVLPTAPATGHQTVLVGRGLMANAAVLPERLTIKPGSAGFGVPRGSVNRLAHVSRSMDQTSRPMTVATERPIDARPAGFGMEPGFHGSPASLPDATSTTHPASPAPHPTPHP